MDKSSLRKSLLEKRQGLSAGEVELRSQKIFQTFTAHVDQLLLPNYQEIALYFPIRGEVDTRPFFKFFHARKKRVLFPKTTDEGLTFHPVGSWSELQLGKFGIGEPQPLPGTAPSKPEIVFVPGVAFGRDGHRLGFGAGYYDKTIEAWSTSHEVRLIGLGYDFQIQDELPSEPHDRAVDFIVSEKELIKRGSL